MEDKRKMIHPKAEKRGDMWRCRVKIDGVTHSITDADKEKCEAKALALKAGTAEAKRNPGKLTLSSAIDRYIAERDATLSPSTIEGYRRIQRQRFKRYQKRQIAAFNQPLCQRMVNEEARIVAPKTLENAWRFVSSVIYELTGNRYSVRLPQVMPKAKPYLDPDQIQLFCDAIRGEKCEIPALLGLCSLRKSEVLDIHFSDIDLSHNRIIVHGATVKDENGEYRHKDSNKTSRSYRTIPFVMPQLRAAVEAIPQEVRAEDGCVVTCHPDTYRKQVNRICERNGLPLVGTHGLRRSFASLCYSLSISEEVCMTIGGWDDVGTMRKIYTQISQNDLHAQTGKLEAFFSGNKAVTEKSDQKSDQAS